MEERELPRLQLLQRRFYDLLVPTAMSACSVRSSQHAKRQECLYQYASGFIIYRPLKAVIEDAMEGPQTQSQWLVMQPSNPEYVEKHGLNKAIKFGRTIYIPYNRLLVISGATADEKIPVRDVFEFDLVSKRVERKQNIIVGRTSFAAHYTFGDRYLYAIGGCNAKETMIADCERYDLFRHKWTRMPSMNEPRGNPGTLLTKDKRYLYAFQGFINTFASPTGNMFHFGNQLQRQS